MATQSKSDVRVGNKAPNARVIDKDGNAFKLSDLWEEKPLVLVFTRHKGCPFCRQYLGEFQKNYARFSEKGANVAAIMMGNQSAVKEFLTDRKFSFKVYGSGGNAVHRAYGLKRFTETGDLFNPVKSAGEIFKSISVASKYGLGIPEGDVAQLGGTFVIDTDGTILFAHQSELASDNAPLSAVLNALEEPKIQS